MTALLDGTALTFSSYTGSSRAGNHIFESLTETLTGGVVSSSNPLHVLSISGTSITGNPYEINVVAVPLPAGAWFFMTGLIGLLYSGKKKTQLV